MFEPGQWRTSWAKTFSDAAGVLAPRRQHAEAPEGTEGREASQSEWNGTVSHNSAQQARSLYSEYD